MMEKIERDEFLQASEFQSGSTEADETRDSIRVRRLHAVLDSEIRYDARKSKICLFTNKLMFCEIEFRNTLLQGELLMGVPKPRALPSATMAVAFQAARTC